ncbi:MAG: YncE family protein [Terriglobia bacterium]
MRRLWLILFCGLFGFVTPLWSAQVGPLRQVQTIILPNVRGRIDHLGVDIQGERLFVAALGNDTLEIINLRAGKLLRTLAGLQEPQGVLFVPGMNKIFVDSAGDGSCRVFDAASYRLLDTIRFPSDADDVRYDPSRKLVYIGYGGHGNAGLRIVSASTDKVMAKIPLPRHPEAFSISPSRIFVNIPSAGNIIAVVDRRKRIMVSRWTIRGARENFPMALDRADHRLFIATRQSAELLVFDSSSGREVTSLPCVGVADDAYYDPQRKFIYISGGEGFLDVFKQDDPDHYTSAHK